MAAMQPGETHETYAARLREQHGPPPQRVIDIVAAMHRTAAHAREAS